MLSRRILTAEQAEAQSHVRDSLTAVISSRESVVLVGSGCSMPMFPSWRTLVRELAEVAAQSVPTGFALPEQWEDDLEALQSIRDSMEQHHKGERFAQHLLRTFEMNDRQPASIHKLLVNLPFRAYLTTNYELLIERALEQARGPLDRGRSLDLQSDVPYFIGKSIRAMAESASAEEVIHLHGRFDHPETMVVTVDDYHRAYGIPTPRSSDAEPSRIARPPYAQILLSALMLTRRIVFIGFGMRDPFLMRVLQAATEFSWEWDQPIHYAIMPIEESDAAVRWEEARRLRSMHGVEVLFYEVYSGDYSGLTATMEDIAARLDVLPEGALHVEAPDQPTGQVQEEFAARAEARQEVAVPQDLELLTRARIQRNLTSLERSDPSDSGVTAC